MNNTITYEATEKLHNDWIFKNAISHEFENGKGTIVLKEGVTEIWRDTFRFCGPLTSINIPDKVTSIGEGAFYGCHTLTSINIPNSIISINKDAFAYCEKLSSVYYNGDILGWCGIKFGNALANPLWFCMKSKLYVNNKLVTDLIIPSSIAKINDFIFCGAKCLKSITIPNSITYIGKDAFRNCFELIGTVTIPNSVTEIGEGAFGNCRKLTSIVISDSVIEIGDNAFEGCSGLTSIEFGNSVKTVGHAAFWNCGVKEPIYNAHCFAYFPNGYAEKYVIPNGIQKITKTAFVGCDKLISIVIPNSVTEIGENAFYNCSNLTSVVMSVSVKRINQYAFRNCFELISINIPDSLNEIEDNAFEGCNNLSQNVKDLIMSINDNAWSYHNRSIEDAILDI